MAGACDFDRVAMSSLGIKPFEVGVDRSIRPGDDHPTRFFSPCRRGDYCLEIVRGVGNLRSRHEIGLLHRKIMAAKYSWNWVGSRYVETASAVFFIAPDLLRALEEALSVVPLRSLQRLACALQHTTQSGNRWIGARNYYNYGSPIAMRDKDARSVLQCEDTLYGGHIILIGRLGLLDHGDFEAIPDEVVVNAPPARRTVRPGTVDEDDIFHFGLLSL